MNYIYAPGCALLSYKPQLAERLKEEIEKTYDKVGTMQTCCFSRPEVDPSDLCIITPCTTCAQNYAKQYPEAQIRFFLSDLAESETFPFPDYGGARMSIQDTCSARTNPVFLATLRRLLERMNITLVEPAKSGSRAKCCGQIMYGKADNAKIENFMKVRAAEMPCDDVVVYCASCIYSMQVGGKNSRYILDLLFNEPTIRIDCDNDEWHRRLYRFRK